MLQWSKVAVSRLRVPIASRRAERLVYAHAFDATYLEMEVKVQEERHSSRNSEGASK